MYKLSLKKIGDCGDEKRTWGRRKGEEGLGSQRYIEIYNHYVKVLDDYLDDKNMKLVLKSWVEAAMGWVNHDPISLIDHDAEPELVPVKKRIKAVVAKVRTDLDF